MSHSLIFLILFCFLSSSVITSSKLVSVVNDDDDDKTVTADGDGKTVAADDDCKTVAADDDEIDKLLSSIIFPSLSLLLYSCNNGLMTLLVRNILLITVEDFLRILRYSPLDLNMKYCDK